MAGALVTVPLQPKALSHREVLAELGAYGGRFATVGAQNEVEMVA